MTQTLGAAKVAEAEGSTGPAATAPTSMSIAIDRVQLALAPSVELVGQAEGTGFEDAQWLVKRDGRFIQLSALLYQVLDNVDGQRTLAEIGAAVTQSTDWLVTGEDVWSIAQAKLIPSGLLAFRDGSAEGWLVTSVKRTDRSPLGLSLHKKFIGPQLIEPFASVLQWLYEPPVTMAVLVAVAIAEWWLYVVHGLAGSIQAALFVPGALPVIFVLLLVAALFHELGHASALRYGGGKVRGIGAGLYLLYPVLYSDVTDSYRLGRWARVRTDLGGFYFHLIFALCMVGVAVVTGQEFLLVLMFLINMAIISECIPFVRYDGYWALADITGIPDFFSQMGPFLATLLPSRLRTPMTQLPPLKGWVKAVFIAYIVATVPVLAGLYILMVKGLPFLIMHTWDAFTYQMELFSFAWPAGDFVQVGACAAQSVFLALPVLTSLFLFYRVSRSVTRALSKWSAPTLRRRLAGAFVAATLVSSLAFVWTPEVEQVASAWAPVDPPPDTLTFNITERDHVDTPVVYPQTPPVAGDHAPIWQNCGFYDSPIANENGVHSLEHGAVWITYAPDLNEEQVDLLHEIALSHRYVLVSPMADLPAPVVASAWDRQLSLNSTDDPRLEQFVRAFERGPQAPESGGPCIRGEGDPA